MNYFEVVYSESTPDLNKSIRIDQWNTDMEMKKKSIVPIHSNLVLHTTKLECESDVDDDGGTFAYEVEDELLLHLRHRRLSGILGTDSLVNNPTQSTKPATLLSQHYNHNKPTELDSTTTMEKQKNDDDVVDDDTILRETRIHPLSLRGTAGHEWQLYLQMSQKGMVKELHSSSSSSSKKKKQNNEATIPVKKGSINVMKSVSEKRCSLSRNQFGDWVYEIK